MRTLHIDIFNVPDLGTLKETLEVDAELAAFCHARPLRERPFPGLDIPHQDFADTCEHLRLYDIVKLLVLHLVLGSQRGVIAQHVVGEIVISARQGAIQIHIALHGSAVMTRASLRDAAGGILRRPRVDEIIPKPKTEHERKREQDEQRFFLFLIPALAQPGLKGTAFHVEITSVLKIPFYCIIFQLQRKR